MGPVVCVYISHISIGPGLCYEDDFSQPILKSGTKFFDDGDAALLLHGKNHQRLHSSGRPDTKGTLWVSRAQTRQRKIKDITKLQAIAAVAASDYCFSRNVKKFRSYDRSRQRQVEKPTMHVHTETFSALHKSGSTCSALHDTGWTCCELRWLSCPSNKSNHIL